MSAAVAAALFRELLAERIADGDASLPCYNCGDAADHVQYVPTDERDVALCRNCGEDEDRYQEAERRRDDLEAAGDAAYDRMIDDQLTGNR